MRHCYYCHCELVPGSNRKGVAQPDNTATRDHLIPVARGGKGIRGNKVDACMACNQDKGRLTLEEYQVVLAYRKGELMQWAMMLKST